MRLAVLAPCLRTSAIGVQSAAKELIQKHGFEYELTSRFNQDAIENFLLLLNRELKDLQLTQKHSVGKKNRKLEKKFTPVTSDHAVVRMFRGVYASG